MGCLESSGVPVLYIGRTVPNGSTKDILCAVVAGSGGSVQTVGVRGFTGMISSFLF